MKASQTGEDVIGKYGTLKYTDDTRTSFLFVIRDLDGKITHTEELKIGDYFLCKMIFISIEKDTSRRSRLIKRYIKRESKKASSVRVMIRTQKPDEVYLTITKSRTDGRAKALVNSLKGERIFQKEDGMVEEDCPSYFLEEKHFFNVDKVPSSGYLLCLPEP